MMRVVINKKQFFDNFTSLRVFCKNIREDFTSLFSPLFLLTSRYSAGIARVVKVKLARAQGVHDDVEDTELAGG